jgi:UDP-N-acetylmuramate-alanine ligase
LVLGFVVVFLIGLGCTGTGRFAAVVLVEKVDVDGVDVFELPTTTATLNG